MFWTILLKCIPKTSTFRKLFDVVWQDLSFVHAVWWQGTCDRSNTFHTHELVTHDVRFNLQEAQRELVRRREVAREQGIGPDDPQYPTLFGIYRERGLA